MGIDIKSVKSMDIRELRTLKIEVDKALHSYEDRQRQAALEEVKQIAQKYRVPLNELLDAPRKSKKPVAPKYQHPDDSSLTWSGRGRKPQWVEEQLAAGKSLADLKI